jgi:hypothetical protein
MTENDPTPYDPQLDGTDGSYDLEDALERRERQLAMRKIEQAVDLARIYALQAAQFLVDLMEGFIKDPDGNLIEVHDINLRRLAAQDILKIAGILASHPPRADHENGRAGNRSSSNCAGENPQGLPQHKPPPRHLRKAPSPGTHRRSLTLQVQN